MLKKIKVLDFSRLVPGAYASMLLADLGATVIKVENMPQGDYLRNIPPLLGNESVFSLATNRGKKSIALDFTAPEAQQLIYKLVQESDVVLENFRPGTMAKYNLDYHTLYELNPRLIYCSLSGYGQQGINHAKAGHDANFLAESGVLGLNTHAGERPVIPGVQIAGLSGAMFATNAIVAALYCREVSGEGKYLDISLIDSALSWFSVIGSQSYIAGQEIEAGKMLFAAGTVCYNVYETKDHQYLVLGALEVKFWQSFCQRLGREDLLTKQMEKADKENTTYKELVAIFAAKSLSEWLQVFADTDICLTPVLTPQEVMDSPYIQEKNLVFQIQHPNLGNLKQFHSPLSQNSGQQTFTPPPAMGENTYEILKFLGISKEVYKGLKIKKVIL